MATTADAETGSGSLSFFPAVVDAATISDCSTTTDVVADAITTTTDAAAGSGSCSCSAAVAVTAAVATTTAVAANALITKGPSMRTLSECNNEYGLFIYMIKARKC